MALTAQSYFASQDYSPVVTGEPYSSVILTAGKYIGKIFAGRAQKQKLAKATRRAEAEYEQKQFTSNIGNYFAKLIDPNQEDAKLFFDFANRDIASDDHDGRPARHGEIARLGAKTLIDQARAGIVTFPDLSSLQADTIETGALGQVIHAERLKVLPDEQLSPEQKAEWDKIRFELHGIEGIRENIRFNSQFLGFTPGVEKQQPEQGFDSSNLARVLDSLLQEGMDLRQSFADGQSVQAIEAGEKKSNLKPILIYGGVGILTAYLIFRS
ncbi:MAG: hypothetical protein FMNOHCHN_03650 [Ignavibacteriaceae bacterium]|nr:hypothetical protein [Ignavibacteriaceae bacterium]